MKKKSMFDHKHPLSLIDLWSEQLQREEDSEEDEEENDDALIAKQDFRCSCFLCGEEINWYHRVCLKDFDYGPRRWIYKCEKCIYYTHFDCATSRNEPFMSILASPRIGKSIKKYEDDEHPDLLHLPFKDPSYSLLKHLFFKEDGLEVTKTHDSHQHPLILEDVTYSTSSRISYHDPMKRIELLCDGCVRPITSGPIYVCAIEEDEHCNFVLHEWCSRLPTELKDYFHHQNHTLILHYKTPGNKFFGVFRCDICNLLCSGFVYCCKDCEYHTDVNCAFLPKEITHTSHPNHLLSRVYETNSLTCLMCGYWISDFCFRCNTCSVYLDVRCALLIPETTRHKCDKHPMKLSYFPIENHKNDYFCEVCEYELNPQLSFYHCRECMQSMHTACAPSILRYETYTTRGSIYADNAVHKFVNMKFGGTYNNKKVHPHTLSFVQGIKNYGECAGHDCDDRDLHQSLVFKCLSCEFVLHYKCCERMIS